MSRYVKELYFKINLLKKKGLLRSELLPEAHVPVTHTASHRFSAAESAGCSGGVEMLVSVGSSSCCPLTQKVKLELVDAKCSHHRQSSQLSLGSLQMEEHLLTLVRQLSPGLVQDLVLGWRQSELHTVNMDSKAVCNDSTMTGNTIRTLSSGPEVNVVLR